jgi:hypothetical protein
MNITLIAVWTIAILVSGERLLHRAGSSRWYAAAFSAAAVSAMIIVVRDVPANLPTRVLVAVAGLLCAMAAGANLSPHANVERDAEPSAGR